MIRKCVSAMRFVSNIRDFHKRTKLAMLALFPPLYSLTFAVSMNIDYIKLINVKLYIAGHRSMFQGCRLNLYQWRIQDFPEEGAPTPRGGRQHTILPNFPKYCMKLKEFGPPGGGRASKILLCRSATVYSCGFCD